MAGAAPRPRPKPRPRPAKKHARNHGPKKPEKFVLAAHKQHSPLQIPGALFFKQLFPEKQELGRKIVHIGIGPVVPLAWWLEIPQDIAIVTAIIITIALTLNHRFRFVEALEDINRESFGTIFYAVSIALLIMTTYSFDQATNIAI